MTKPIRILTVGGGSGGHILPVGAVIEELLKLDPKLEIKFWCDKKTRRLADEIILKYPVKIEQISAGKLRRYHHLKWWQNLQWSILRPNLIDGVKVVIGLFQSLFKLIIWRPKVVFIKGGFVCLPVGLAARILGIKIVIHDSDTTAGLTNRILSRFATKIATGYPTNYYNYPASKTVYTGIPIKTSYRLISADEQLRLKTKLGFESSRSLVVITGGGMGSKLLNDTLLATVIQHRLSTNFVLIAGERDYQRVIASYKPIKNQPASIKIIDFVNNLDEYILASDVVICRAGASTIAEIASANKPAIVIPNPKLTGDHQAKNAQILSQSDSAIVINEAELISNPEKLNQTIERLLSELSSPWVKNMSINISRFANNDAASQISQIIINLVKK